MLCFFQKFILKKDFELIANDANIKSNLSRLFFIVKKYTLLKKERKIELQD